MVLETANLSEIEFSEYCRERGIYPEQVKEWKEACMNANDNSKTSQAKASKELQKERRAKEIRDWSFSEEEWLNPKQEKETKTEAKAS